MPKQPRLKFCCPYCGADNVTVVGSTPYTDRVKRRRKCLSCGYMFFTGEFIIPEGSRVETLAVTLRRKEAG